MRSAASISAAASDAMSRSARMCRLGAMHIRWAGASTSPVFYQPFASVLDLPVVRRRRGRPRAVPARRRKPIARIDDDRQRCLDRPWRLHQAGCVKIGGRRGRRRPIRRHARRACPTRIVAGGAARRFAEHRFSDGIIADMRQLGWWRYAFWDLAGASLSDPRAFIDSVAERVAGGIRTPVRTRRISHSARSESAGESAGR